MSRGPGSSMKIVVVRNDGPLASIHDGSARMVLASGTGYGPVPTTNTPPANKKIGQGIPR